MAQSLGHTNQQIRRIRSSFPPVALCSEFLFSSPGKMVESIDQLYRHIIAEQFSIIWSCGIKLLIQPVKTVILFLPSSNRTCFLDLNRRRLHPEGHIIKCPSLSTFKPSLANIKESPHKDPANQYKRKRKHKDPPNQASAI